MRRAGPLAAGLLAALLILGFVPAVGAQTYEVGEPIELRGFASGTVAHLRAAESGGTRLVDNEVAFSSAVVDADADGVNGAKLNEMSRLLQSDVGNKLTYARGTGLEVGLAQTVPQPTDEENQLILAGLAEQTAPPDNDEPVIEETAVEGDPLAYASAVRGEAHARSQDSGLLPEVCVLGDDLSRGLGYVADAELVDAGGDEASPNLDAAVLALDDADPERSASQSVSRMRLVPTGTQNNFGLQSEVRETIAPVTLLQTDTAVEGAETVRLVTIEFLGEWFLRATAMGKPGGATVEWGTGDVETGGELTSVIRILDGEGTAFMFSFEDLLGPDGVTIPGDPLINISIAEGPRALTAPGEFPDPESSPEVAADGTRAVAAWDVLRVRLLASDETTVLAEARVGHMETSVQVPVGGVNCPIPVTKTADPTAINIGESGNESEITITVHNVFDCDLADVVLTDRIRQREGDPDFRLVSADPAAESPSMPTGNLTTADVVWQLGDIPSGEERSVTLILQSATKGGIIRDIAQAVGRFENCIGEAAEGLAIAGLNMSGFSNPVDIAIPLAVTGVGGAGTPAAGAALSVAALGVASFLRRRRR